MAEFRVLLVGSGGREYAFLRKLLQAPEVKVTVAPGLSGMLYFLDEDARSRTTLVPAVKATDLPAIIQLAKEMKPDLVVVGPEDPLIMGLADLLQKEGIPVFGFCENGAQLEGSKWFCKNIYQEFGFATAPALKFDEPDSAIKGLFDFKKDGRLVVLKCDNPALGKGVIAVSPNASNYWDEVAEKIQQMFDPAKPLGFLAKSILLEERYPILNEWSAMQLIGPNNFSVPLMPTKDHKLFDGQNTGGMGIITPAPDFGPANMPLRQVIVKVIRHALFDRSGIEPCGIFYEGLNRMAGIDYLVEVNVRGGDPETQGQLEFIEGVPLHELLLAAVEGRPEIAEKVIVPENKVLVGVVMASKGYPGSYEKGKEIFVPKKLSAPGIIFPAGLVWEDGKLFTAGGRVLMVVGVGNDVVMARLYAYTIVNSIKHDGALVWRDDIGLNS
ncbi:MAG: phosphoribosylglycinamide synthetase C domain-containing protein [Patescibacteria group bacterium]|nr:phosphoribosylglycinamide synthetase C domain-containing protein [Patescibacteria group bacterium]